MITLAVITYIDRVGIAVALPLIRDELKLSPIQMGWTLAAFAWAYAVFEIPGGWLGDKIGPRRVLMRIVVWWSVFTAATGWVWNPSSLIVTRALFGAGEAGAFPNLTRVLTTWLPVKDRERTQAWVWLATRLSGAFTPILVASLICGNLVAPDVRALRRDRHHLGGALLPLVPRLTEQPPEREPGGVGTAAAGKGHGHRPRRGTVGRHLLQPARVAALHPVHVPRVRLVVLHQLAPDLPPRRARHELQDGSTPRRPAAAPRRRRMPGLGVPHRPA